MSLEDCIRKAAEIGCEGYEIVAAQMIASYPYVTDEVAGEFARYSGKYGIKPICYAANMDRGLLKGRDLTDDEMLSRAINDIKSAHRLGCGVMRQQYLIGPEAMVRLAPYAEEYGVRVGIEIHNPETPTSPKIMEYREAFDKCGSQYLGFITDFGCFSTKPNKPYWDRALANGAQPEMLDMLAQMRYDEVPQEEATERLLKAGANSAVLGAVASSYGFVQFRREADLEGLKSIIPQNFEFHAKCHYVSEDLEEASIPYDEVLSTIVDSNFDGYVVVEYEDEGGYDSVEMTRRCVAMIKKILNNK
jgi:sugar phosphate isomerase/epimerase